MEEEIAEIMAYRINIQSYLGILAPAKDKKIKFIRDK